MWYCRLEVALEASQAKQRDLWTWHERCDTLYRWVNDRYGRLGPRPPSPKESLGGIKRQESVIEVKARTMKIHVFWSVHELGISPHYNQGVGIQDVALSCVFILCPVLQCTKFRQAIEADFGLFSKLYSSLLFRI